MCGSSLYVVSPCACLSLSFSLCMCVCVRASCVRVCVCICVRVRVCVRVGIRGSVCVWPVPEPARSTRVPCGSSATPAAAWRTRHTRVLGTLLMLDDVITAIVQLWGGHVTEYVYTTILSLYIRLLSYRDEDTLHQMRKPWSVDARY